MKKTPLYENHKRLNGRLIDFGGWEMPVQYSSILKEHKATREKAGIFDTSHMGEIIVRGKDSLDLVQRLTTNDASKLNKGEAQYSMMCHKKGGVVDDLYVYRTGEEEYMLVVNACNTRKDLKHAKRIVKIDSNVEVEDISKKTVMFALQGPEAEIILNRYWKINKHIPEKKNTFSQFRYILSNIIISRTGYTGENGFELFFSGQKLARIMWENIIRDGATPCGLGARDTLRLEMGYPLYGHELNDKITPLEAGLEWVVCFEKDFLGKEALVKQKKDGLKKKLVGFELIDKGIARQHHKVIKTGKLWRFYASYDVTSGTRLEKSIGMAYVPTDYSKEGTGLTINIRGKLAKARIVKRPFVKK